MATATALRVVHLLLWHGRLWLVDHGAALYLQHGGLVASEHAGRSFALIAGSARIRAGRSRACSPSWS